MRPALIVFQKNLVKGRVKSRLARTVGDDRALIIYESLVNFTVGMCEALRPGIDVHVFYTDEVEQQDAWTNVALMKHLQYREGDLGERMAAAFRQIRHLGYDEICIIGTDCPYLTPEHLFDAFKLLKTNDVVLGPALDGGFYLLAVSTLKALDFANITWSTSSVLSSYLANLSTAGLLVSQLPILEDIDDEMSYKRLQNYLNSLINK